MSDLTGSRLELDHRYVVGESLHRGPMATLYAARWELFDLPVYIRLYDSLVKLRLRHRDTTRIRDLVESRAGRVRGANLPDTIDAGNDGTTRPFLVFRLPEGQLLLDRLTRGGPLDADETVEIIRSVADALGTCRAAGVVHRGPTVDRVWLGDDGHVVLLGAGEVLYREETLAMSGPATPELVWHLPPEAFDVDPRGDDDEGTPTGRLKLVSRPVGNSHEQQDDPRAEVYTLACLAYHCINGHHPYFFDRADASSGIMSTMRDTPLELRGLSDEHPAAVEIARGMSRDPDERHPDPAAFARALAQAFDAPDDEEDEVDDETTVEPPGRRVTRVQTTRSSTADRLWKAAAIMSTVSLAGWFALVSTRPETIVITSDPPGVPLEEVVGHVSEARGTTPVLLRDRPAMLPVTLRAVSPDGRQGEPVTFSPGELEDLGRCRGLHVELAFPEDE